MLGTHNLRTYCSGLHKLAWSCVRTHHFNFVPWVPCLTHSSTKVWQSCFFKPERGLVRSAEWEEGCGPQLYIESHHWHFSPYWNRVICHDLLPEGPIYLYVICMDLNFVSRGLEWSWSRETEMAGKLYKSIAVSLDKVQAIFRCLAVCLLNQLSQRTEPAVL